MLKVYRNVLAAGVVALGLAACGDNVTVTNPPPVTPVVHSVFVVPASLTANVGQAGITFVASVVADSGISSAVTWTSTNLTVATINPTTGAVVTVAAGQTTIIATSVGDTHKTGAGSLVVVALPPNITSFSVTPQNASISVGGLLQANPSWTLAPGAPAATVAWSVAPVNNSIATVSANGQITGIATGAAVITATLTSGTQTATATVGVTVGAGPTGVISFSITPPASTLFATQTQNVIAVLNAPGQTYPVTFTSSAPSIASVGSGSSVTCPTGSPTGAVCTQATITALAQGSAVISASIGTGATVTTQASVITVAQGVSISINSITAGATAGTVGCAGVVNAPVVLTNVNCQIDVNMNLSAGVQPLDSLVVRMKQPSGFKTLAKQIYGNTIPSSGIVTVSINTANFVKVPTTTTVINGVSYVAGTVAVDLFNGPTTLQTQVYPHLGAGGIVFNCQVGATDATCAIVNSLVMNNTDGWTADIQKCTGGTGVIAVAAPLCPAAVPTAVPPTGGFATDVGGAPANLGTTYWGGPTGSGQTTAEIYAVIYDDNPGYPSGSALNRCSNLLGNNTGCITTVTWSLGAPVANIAGNTAATLTTGGPVPVYSVLPAVASAGLQWCAPATQTALPFRQTFGNGTGATNGCATYENTTMIRDNILITNSIDGQNNPFALVGTLTGTAPIAGPANPNFTLIPSAVVTASTPDSGRFDYKPPASANIIAPNVLGTEGFNWVNANFAFTPGTLFAPACVVISVGCPVLLASGDFGVGAALNSYLIFASANGGTGGFPTLVTTGAQLPETNQNCTGVGCDGFLLRASASDRLGNTNNSVTSAAFGVDKTAPVIRYSTTTAPSSFPSAYVSGGNTQLALDSTTYAAFQGIYGANVVTPGAQDLFVGAAAGTNDSVRIEALDSRSGISRFIESTVKFAQGGATGAVSPIYSISSADVGTTTIDGWVKSLALHATNGRNVGAPPVNPGYYTTTEYVIDRAGNVSGCPQVGTATSGANSVVVGGSICLGAAVGPSTPSPVPFTNPATTLNGGTQPGTQANLFARRTLAIDPGPPSITGVSPNNSYKGDSAVTFTLGAQSDLEVIDSRLRIHYPTLYIGDGTTTASNGLVWSYALSSTFMGASPNGNTGTGPSSANPTFTPTNTSAPFGYFLPIGIRFDNSIINPIVTGVSGTPAMILDQFTVNVQETCTGAAAPVATCNFNGDPVLLATVPAAKPDSVAVRVRDVFGSWIFNTTASAVTGVSAEFASPILSATVATPGGYAVTYYNAGVLTSCPQGGAVQLANTVSCVNTGVNWRAEPSLSTPATTEVFRSTESLSTTLPIFTRVDLFGLNAANEWVFIVRCAVPGTIVPNAGSQGCGLGATVAGTDNGNERYWLYTFSTIGSGGLTQFRAVGVNGSGFGLASTRQP